MLQNFGTALSREQMKKVMGGFGDNKCTSTCWAQSQGGDELGSCDVTDCDDHSGDCKLSWPTAVKATCSCG